MRYFGGRCVVRAETSENTTRFAGASWGVAEVVGVGYSGAPGGRGDRGTRAFARSQDLFVAAAGAVACAEHGVVADDVRHGAGAQSRGARPAGGRERWGRGRGRGA